jgi:phosphomannomutase
MAFEHGVLGPLMQRIEAGFQAPRIDRSDGLKLLWPDAWIHVRASNTEPLLRMAAEAASAERLEELYGRLMEYWRAG